MKNLEAASPTPNRLKHLVTLLIVSTLVAVVFVTGWANAGAQQDRDELRIELGNNGFTPNQVQHAPGSFAIAVENATLSGEYKLRLKAEDGTVLSEVQVQKGSSAWTDNLQTGRYTLTEFDHPQWLCNLNVQ